MYWKEFEEYTKKATANILKCLDGLTASEAKYILRAASDKIDFVSRVKIDNTEEAAH